MGVHVENAIGKQEIWLEAVVRALIHHIKQKGSGKCHLGELGGLPAWKRAKGQLGCNTFRDFLELKRLKTVFAFEQKDVVIVTEFALQLGPDEKVVPLTEKQKVALARVKLGPNGSLPMGGVQLPSILADFLPSFPLPSAATIAHYAQVPAQKAISPEVTDKGAKEDQAMPRTEAEPALKFKRGGDKTTQEPALTLAEATQKLEHLIRKRINKSYMDKHREDRGWCWLADLVGGFQANPLWQQIDMQGKRTLEGFIRKSPAFIVHDQRKHPKKPSQKPYVTLGAFAPDGRRGTLRAPLPGVVGGHGDSKNKFVIVNALDIRYTHAHISSSFQNGTSLDRAIKDVLHGGSPEVFPPMEVVWHDGLLYSLSNRRLFLFRILTMLNVMTGVRVVVHDPGSGRVHSKRWDDRLWRMATKWERAYTTSNDGVSVVVESEFRESSWRAEAKRLEE